MTNPVRQLLLPLAALFQIAGSSLPQIFNWGVTIGERSNALDTAIVPAGWAFSIWGLIFLWSLVFAFHAASLSAEKARLADRVAWPAVGVFTANGVWALYTPFMGLDLVSELIILVGLFSALAAALIAGRYGPKTTAERFVIAAPLGLVAGWLTAASAVGGSSVLLGLGVEMTDTVLLAILAEATVLAVIITVLRAPFTYPLAMVWALAAVISKNLGGETLYVYAAGAAILIIAVVSLVVWRRADSR